ncbi:hypothetical protein [Formosa sediminum]|nr:hypothetical protein [Formosa sediminum]
MLGKVNSINLPQAKERILPLIIFSIILLIVIKRIITPYDFIELYYFFVAILASTMSTLMLNILNFKSSIHMMAICGVCMFFIGLSIHFSINILMSLAIIFFIMGAVATSRLSLKAHNYPELLIGCATGVIPQLILIPNWL